MKIQKTVAIKEVARARDKLDALFEKEKKKLKFTEEELKYNNPEMLCEGILEWCQDELRDTFDFDGEEDE